MAAHDPTLIKGSSLADAFPDRWWIPPAAALAELAPGHSSVKVLAVEPDEEGAADPWSATAIWIAVEERDAELISGTIEDSEIERAGYRVGDRITVPLDRVLDLVEFGPDGEPVLNEGRARFAMGKRVLVGLTSLDQSGEVVERHQLAARVGRIEANRGIELRLDDGTRYWLPPDARSLREAPPGDYTLRASGQVIRDPDYLCFWTVTLSGENDPLREGFQASRE